MLSLLLLSVSVSAPIPSDAGKGLKPDPNKLDGVWKLTSRVSPRGTSSPLPPSLAESYTLVVVNGAYAFRNHVGTIATDPQKKALDLKATDGAYKDGTVAGLFERKDNTLTVAMPSFPSRGKSERPSELKTDRNASHYLYTFERDTTVTAEQAAEKLKDRQKAITSTRVAPIEVRAVPAPGGPAPVAASQDDLRKALERIDQLEKRVKELESRK